MTCVPLERLQSFRRQELSDEERRLVERHLAECRSCRQLLVDDLRWEEATEGTAEGTTAAPPLKPLPEEILRQVRNLVPEDRKQPRRRQRRRTGISTWLPLAAVLVALIGGFLLYPRPEPHVEKQGVFRDLDQVSERLEPIEPAASAEVEGPVRFRWTAVAEAKVYRLVILSSEGTRLVERETQHTEVEIDTSGLGGVGDVDVDVYWLVKAQMPGGEQILSPARPMTLRSGPPGSTE